MTTTTKVRSTREILNKVPEVTVYFWIIKVLCTTVGETAADYLNVNLSLGLTGTSVVTGGLLAVALAFQFRSNRYRPGIYWVTVALVSVFGTLVTDNLTDKLGIALETSTIVFAVLLSLTFLVWYANEKTLGIHSIFTVRREAFYWLAVLFSFALGTATGDLMAEGLGLGYLNTGMIVASLIALTAIGWRLGLNSILSFWIIYILTRPLGASIGDYLSQPQKNGGLGLGTTVTSAIFIGGILIIVGYLSYTKADVSKNDPATVGVQAAEKGGIWQTAAVVSVLLIASGTAYTLRKSSLQDAVAAEAPSAETSTGSTSPLGDLSQFRTITQDTLDLLNAGKQTDATTRIDDLESSWDKAQARLKIKDSAAWTTVDDLIDPVLRQLRSTSPDLVGEKAALTALLAGLA